MVVLINAKKAFDTTFLNQTNIISCGLKYEICLDNKVIKIIKKYTNIRGISNVKGNIKRR